MLLSASSSLIIGKPPAYERTLYTFLTAPDFDYCFNNYTETIQVDCEYFVSIGECNRTDVSRRWMLTYCRRECSECAGA